MRNQRQRWTCVLFAAIAAHSVWSGQAKAQPPAAPPEPAPAPAAPEPAPAPPAAPSEAAPAAPPEYAPPPAPEGAVDQAFPAAPPAGEPQPPPEQSSDYAVEDISGLSLEQLLNLPTSVASKREEKTSEAPASITAYSEHDMKATGYYTLGELANITAGYSSTIMYGERVFETRGQKAGSFNNNKHLVYVDGIPINHARNYKAPADHDLPLFFAKRVEFLKGPASALYGTSAFFGVVNVVPKTLEKNGTLMETRVSAGTRDQELQVMSNAMYKNDTGHSALYVGYYDKGASRDYVGITNSGSNRFWDDQKSVFINASHKLTATALRGLTLGVTYMRKNGGLGESWNEGTFSHPLNDLTWETFVPYMKFDRDLSERITLHSYLMWNRGREKGFYTAGSGTGNGMGTVFGAYEAQVNDIQTQHEIHWRVHDNADYETDVIVGTNVDTRKDNGYPGSDAYNVSADPGPIYIRDATLKRGSDRYNIYSGYVQLRQQLPALSGTIITAGGRVDVGSSPTQNYSQFSPRAGIVQRITDNLNLRAFFGSALRGPGIKEIELNRESKASLERMNLSTKGIKDVSAENIRSVEGGPVWASEHIVASGTAFYNETTDSLDGSSYQPDPTKNPVNIFVNAKGKTKAVGGEVELQVVPVKSLRILANYARARARRHLVGTGVAGTPPTQDVNVEDVPIHKVNAGVIYTAPFDLSAALIARYVSGYTIQSIRPDATMPAPTIPGSQQAGSSFMLDANLVQALPAGFSLWFQLRNIINQDRKLPQHGREDIPLPNISALFSLSYRIQ